MSGIITEVEAYSQDDPASHSFSGKTKRNEAMFFSPGHAYIYRSYGIHWCLNTVTFKEGFGSGVLIRSIQITDGLELALKNRYRLKEVDDLTSLQLRSLSNGPGKVTQALGVDKSLYGTNLLDPNSPLQLSAGVDVDAKLITQTPRIGISKGTETPWRWLVSSVNLPK